MTTKYNELVDHLVTTMKPSIHDQMYNKQKQYEQPFDTNAYANYKKLVDKEKEQIDPHNLTEHIYKLGFRIDTLLSKIISQLDTVLDTEFDPNKVTCSVDDKQVDCDTWEDK